MHELTANQQAALARDKNIAVTAGAGTGKTRILVDRYVDILLNEEVDVRELLAITFTNKAASEMLERVSGNIMLRLETEHEVKKRKKLTHIHNHLSSAHISTVHAFCTRIMREFPLESGNLDPGFRQIDDFEMDLLIDASITEEIKSVNPEDTSWLDLFRLFGPQNIRMMLQKSMNYRYELIKTAQQFNDESVDIIFESLTKQFIILVREQFSSSFLETIQRLSSSLRQSSDSGQNVNDKKEVTLDLIRCFCEEKDPEAISYWRQLYRMTDHFTTARGEAYKSINGFGGKKAWSTIESEWLLQLSEELEPVAFWQKSAISVCPDQVDRVVLQNLMKFNELYLRVDHRYTDKKRQLAGVDYEDLQLMTLNLLEKHEEIRSRIAARFKYIMVDEFQDTNQLQWEIISRLGENKKNKFFIVGDPKQSIYGFRAADVRVFNTVKKDFAAVNAESDHLLFESFRFKQMISQFINHIFSEILKPSDSNQWEVAYESIEPKRDDAEGGQVEFALLDKAEDYNVQAVFIANRILEILATTDYKPGDIAIIIRTRTHLTEIEKHLRDHDISFRTVGGIGFYQGQEIYDVYHLLKFLINPGDDLALVGVLRSPFADISDETLFYLGTCEHGQGYWSKLQEIDQIVDLSEDDKEKLNIFVGNANHWINRRDRIGLYELLSDIFSDSLYRSIVSADLKGEQILANIEKILNYTLNYEKNQSGSIVDFTESLKYLINQYQKEGEAVLDLNEDDTVKIMTIHQSKGLEYPIVFLPFLDQSISSSASHSIYFDDSVGAVAKIQGDQDRNKTSTSDSYFIFDLLKFKQKRKELAELKRLFYVGCTRVKDHLILCAHMREDKIPTETPLSWLMMAINREPDQLQNGWLQLNRDLQILIHRDFEEKITSQDRNRQKSLSILEKISNIKPVRKDSIIIPPVLSQTTDQPKGEIFSATQLLTFKEDRKEYHQRYLLGYFEDDYEKIGLGEIHVENALLRGTLVHKMMERFPHHDIDELFSELDITDEDLILNLKNEIEMLETKIKNSRLIQPALQAQNFKNEISIMRRFGDDYLSGTLDRIYQDEDGQWVILDYKTNHISETEVIPTAARYKVQMDVYSLLIESIFPEQEEYKVGLYFIYADQIVNEVYSKRRIKAYEKEYEQLIEQIKQYYPYTSKKIV